MPDAGPWSLVGFLFTTMVASLAWLLRLFGTGKIVQGIHYEDAVKQRDQAIAAANVATAATSGMMTSVSQLSAQLGNVSSTVDRLAHTDMELATGQVQLRGELAALRADVRRLVEVWDSPGPRPGSRP